MSYTFENAPLLKFFKQDVLVVCRKTKIFEFCKQVILKTFKKLYLFTYILDFFLKLPLAVFLFIYLFFLTMLNSAGQTKRLYKKKLKKKPKLFSLLSFSTRLWRIPAPPNVNLTELGGKTPAQWNWLQLCKSRKTSNNPQAGECSPGSWVISAGVYK